MRTIFITILFFCFIFQKPVYAQQGKEKWSEAKAKAWYAQQPWYVGCNFVPSTAINQLEMWQTETFDTATINRELGWASSIGMNCVRVFLHDLLYKQDPAGFLKRMDTFLKIVDKNNIKVMFVFFDSVWDPYPYLGKQRDPRPGVHNSGWVQSPGKHALLDSTQYKRLEIYVKAVAKRFANDKRILCWDVWNEPDNSNSEPYHSYEPANKTEIVANLIGRVYSWIRSQNPIQPLTSGVWDTESSSDKWIKDIARIQLENSDIITFHNYGGAADFEKLALKVSSYNRPVICTEFMARGNGSTFEAILPVAKKLNTGAICWGLVNGKSNTIHDWSTWSKPDSGEPKLWHHDVFRKDGTPFLKTETDFIKKITGKE